MLTVDVVLEVGQRRSFAIALDWPGWARPGATADAALAAVGDYEQRYRPVAAAAGVAFGPGAAFRVVETVAGTSTTDFGAPGVVAESYRRPVSAADADRLAGLVEAAWRTLGDVASTSPEALRKGPRGGGRDTSQIVAHVIDAETAYSRKLGVSTRGVDSVREALASRLRAGDAIADSGDWPVRYAAMRIAWHALDHAWEIQDRSE